MSTLDRIARLAQAQRTITVHARNTLGDALGKILDRARTNQQGVSQIANAVVAHQIWFR